jgi:tetratricopeptide (TPR) repeat protein
MAAGGTLRLLGDCALISPDGERVPVVGPRSQVAVGIAALSETGLSDAAFARALHRAGGELSEGGLRTLRHRLPPEVKKALGSGANRWRFPGLEVDLLTLRKDAIELRRQGVNAAAADLRDALESAALPLLPDVLLEEDERYHWLALQRAGVERLRIELLEAAIAWSEPRSDPWGDELRRILRELEPERVPPRPVVRRARWSSPTDEITNIGRADARKLIGREHELSLLRRRFDEGAGSQVIFGEGGIGKSDLALTFVDYHAGDYRIRWKLEAETEVELRAGLRRLGRKLGIPSAEGSSLIANEDSDAEQFLADLGDYLRSGFGSPWLLLFDNVERPEDLEAVWRYLPDNGHILITSQWPDWSLTGARDLHLWGLRLEHAMELLADESGRLVEGDEMRAICQELDCHPMLLKHAGMTMRMDGIGPAQYLDSLQSRAEEAVRMWPELDLTRRHAITTYRLAIERAVKQAPGAGPLIEVVSFLAPDLIVESILYEGIAGHVEDLGDGEELRRARRALRQVSLIQDYQRTETFSIHRVMQTVVRLRLTPDEVRARLGAAVDALARALPGPDSVEANERRRWLAPHIEAVISHVEQQGDENLRARTAELASQLGMFRRAQSEWEAAEEAHRRAVDLSKDESDRRSAAMRGVRLANVLRQRGRFSEAEVVLASSLPTLREAAPPDDLDLAYALTVQGRILRTRPDSAPLEAREPLEEALAILDTRRAEQSDHFEQLSRTLNYQAVLLRQLGDYKGAEAASRRGFRLLTEREPEDWLSDSGEGKGRPHRLLAIHLRSLGNLWRLLGRFRDARDAHERASMIITELFDADHTDVGRCLDSLGRVQREYGNFREALESFTRAREISDYRFGEKYPHAATALTNIALTLRELDRYDEALANAEEAVEIYRHNYGDSWEEGVGELRNEHTAWAVFVRADLLTSLAREGGGADPLERAEVDHRQVLRLRKKIYGRRNHPHVASSLQSLGDIANLRGERSQALALQTQARALRVEFFGQESSYWVAQSDARLGALEESRDARLAHLRAAERVWSEQLAPGHPWLRRIRRQIEEEGAQPAPSPQPGSAVP